MSMVIGTNVASLTAQRHLDSSRADLQTSMERLSSGSRINSATDDAAGLAISDRMTSQINGLTQAVRNASDAMSLGQTAEGALDESTAILQRMRDLSVQSVNDTNTSTDRAAMQSEVAELQTELTRIGNSSSFNEQTLLDGSFTAKTFQIGYQGGDTLSLSLNDMRSTALGDMAAGTIVAGTITKTAGTTGAAAVVSSAINVAGVKSGDILSFSVDRAGTATTFSHTFTADATADAAATAFNAANDSAATTAGWTLTNASSGTVTFTNTAGAAALVVSSSTVTATQVALQAAAGSVDISTAAGATSALTSIDTAIKEVGQERAKLGAFQNRLEHTVSNLQSMVENTSAARSRIADADFAVESANLAKNQVLQQAGTAMLSQANASTQNVLSLLK
jgi:flagellin